MKLFCDINEEVQVLTEEVAPGQKNYFIEGIFLMSNLIWLRVIMNIEH